MEFKSFKKIENLKKLYMTITQKIHGTNGQIYIYRDENNNLTFKAGSRTRWLSIEDDNYGFARFVFENQIELIEKLGEGRHFGEWCGKGINAGEGLDHKKFVLFDFRRFNNKELPIQCINVPVLYTGSFSLSKINYFMNELKTKGSKLVPGYMKPEGIVIEVGDNFYKKTFDLEEIAWTKPEKLEIDKKIVNVSYLLQPLRLEKLLSRDESYIREYPKSLARICKDYTYDLMIEEQFLSKNEDDLEAEMKAFGKQVFYFVKTFINDYLKKD